MGSGGGGETPLVPSLDETPDILDEYVIATLFQEVECGSWPNGRGLNHYTLAFIAWRETSLGSPMNWTD